MAAGDNTMPEGTNRSFALFLRLLLSDFLTTPNEELSNVDALESASQESAALDDSDLHSNDDNATSPVAEDAVSDDAGESNDHNISDDNPGDEAPASPDDNVQDENAALSASQEHLSDDEENVENADVMLQQIAEEEASNTDGLIDGKEAI